ncbi:Transcriptional regulatory protein BaeR [Rubrivivax sp. A210]|uniref:response regulator transcription factor n=1 Tax=Rubrivivax sp. A210 TaxID=2772301 RepID=UPI001918E099|nr:response regulator [Rubrivivax sp. A210]CAD5371039.1 Transcriptional regulatory protein BaeR [Rubrivivax sp. A210]
MPRILVIDDSIADLRVLMEMLNAQKWRIAVAFDGNDGYQKATLNPPDLILLDVRMPGLDGFGTCRLLKADARTRSVPVIFLSAAKAQGDRLAGLHLGAVDYILKPYASEEEVVARIEIHLNLARNRRSGDRPDGSGQLALPDGAAVANHTPLLRAATALLLENIAHPPSPEALARRLGTNEKRLNEAFQLTFSQPVFGWLRQQRMRIACELLEQTDTPIGEIALHCGFSTAANFSTAFRERYQASPRDFRQRQRGPARLAEDGT